MKEKRVDIYLSKASLCHIAIIGFGGTFLNEVFLRDERRWIIALLSALAAVISLVIMFKMYSKAKSLSKSKNKLWK